MSTIPANALVRVLPGVLSAGGTALSMQGLVLTNSWRVPIGAVQGFPSALSVSSFFGAAAREAIMAGGGSNLGSGYFGGFNNCTQLPTSMLFAQYNQAAVSAYLLGGSVASLTIAQLAALSGSLTVVMDGYTYTNGSVSLSGASSFTAAAALIQTAINTSLPVGGTTTAGTIAAGTPAVFTGSIAGNVLTVTAMTSGTIIQGGKITGTGIAANTFLSSQLTGTTGGIGTYAIQGVGQIVASTAITETFGVFTAASTITGTFSVGQTLTGTSVPAGSQIVALGTGAGLAGTYYTQLTGTTASTTITASGTAIVVTYDSQSGGFLFTSGSVGTPSTAAYATGTLATSLNLTQALGATISQGAYAATPSGFMGSLTANYQNFVSFTTSFDPDGGSGNAQKLLFAGWVNTTTDRYVYVCWDPDLTPSLSTNAPTCMGEILIASQANGTMLIWEPMFSNYAAFIMGSIASINFNAVNGRITFAFKGQSGLVANVTNQTTYNNLIQNGYNCYAVFATAAQSFIEFQPGSVTGPFEWADTYVNQIWLNNALQLALMVMLQNVNSLPYNNQGYGLIRAAVNDPMAAALNCGVARAGITLSSAQVLEINTAAGLVVSDILQQQGWVMIIQPAAPQTRQARQTPVILLFYTDGESIQQITLNSIVVQ